MSPEARRALCRLCGSEAEELLHLAEAPCTVQTLLQPEHVSADRPTVLTVCRCGRCGLVQARDDPELLGRYADDYLFSVNFSAHARAYQGDLARRWADAHELGGRRVLEVGSGDGYFAALLQGHGCAVTAIDPSPRASATAGGRGLTRIAEGYLTAATFPGETFDAVVARHVLEHVTRPGEFLRVLRHYLGPGGKLFVEVPNLDGIVRNGRFQDFYPEHLSYFDPRSLCAALADAGFEVLETYSIEKGDYLVGVAQRPDADLNGMLSELDRFVARFRSLAEGCRSRGRRLAIWGAGGRCVALMALVRARELGIAYVVDSDPKKWGCFLPTTHLPVVPPEALRTDPVDDLLISATAFQDEILGQLSWFPGGGRRLGVVQPEPRWLGAAEVARHGT